MTELARPSPTIDETEADRRLRADRRDARAMMAKADHRFLAGDFRAASRFYRVIPQLARAGVAIAPDDVTRAVEAAAWLAKRFAEVIDETARSLARAHGGLHPRFAKAIELMQGRATRPPEARRYPQTPLSLYYPDLPYVCFADAAQFDWRRVIEGRFDAIREETSAIIDDDALFRPYLQSTSTQPHGDTHGLLDKKDWSTAFLFENGAPVPERIARCPTAYESVAEHAPLCRITVRAPTIMLSLLRPGAHIPAHTGMLNTRFICHLPLVVPDQCSFRVGSETRVWREGEIMIFDDSVEHEAWNKSDRKRLVLIFDIWRPELEQAEREQIAGLFAAVDAYGAVGSA